MPEPLVLDSTDRPHPVKTAYTVSLWMVPTALLGLWWMGWPLPTMDGERALQYRVGVVVAALLLALKRSRQNVTLQENPQVVVLPRPGVLSTLAIEWWNIAIMSPAAVVGCVALYDELQNMLRWGVHPPIYAGTLLITWWLVFALSNYFFSALAGSPIGWRILEDGIGTGLTCFTEWENLDHVSERGGMFFLFHKANPYLPLAATPASRGARDLLLPHLEAHEVPLRNRLSLKYDLLQMGVVAVAAGITYDGLWAYRYLPLLEQLHPLGHVGLGNFTRVLAVLGHLLRDPRVVVLAVAVVERAASQVLEGLRGLPYVTQTHPVVMERESEPDATESPASPVPLT